MKGWREERGNYNVKTKPMQNRWSVFLEGGESLSPESKIQSKHAQSQ